MRRSAVSLLFLVLLAAPLGFGCGSGRAAASASTTATQLYVSDETGGGRIYPANGPSGDVSVVDVRSGAVVQRVAVGGSPWGVALADAQ